MKFYVGDKMSGMYIKGQIVKEYRDNGNIISLNKVRHILHEKEEGSDFVWNVESKLDKKIRLRECKDGWYLYLPEPSRMTWAGENVMVDQFELDGNGFKIKYSNPVDKVVEMFEKNNKKTDLYMEREIEAIDNIRLSMDGMVDRIIERWMNYEVDVYTGFEKLGEVIGGHYGYFYRPCIVKAKKSGRKEERQDRNAKFHRWADLSKGVQQVVAIVEFDDGHIEQVQPDRVVFKEEE